MTIFSKHNQLIFSALASLFVLSSLPSCQREPSPVDENLYLTDEPILIQAAGSDVQTRGLLNKADLPKVDSKVKVYDYLTGFSGVIDGQKYTNGNVMYIDDEVKCITPGSETNPEGVWNFASGHNWRWTRTGTHNFFGWLKYDQKSGLDVTSLFTPSLGEGNVVNVPEIKFDKNTTQFDFSYSEIVTKTETQHSDVEIPLRHLFSALAVTVTNNSPDNAYIKEITLTGFKNKRSATITFDTERQKTAVNYGTGSYEAFFPNWPAASTVDVNYGHSVPKATTSTSGTVPTRFDIIKGTVLGANDPLDHILMWPQLASEFSGENGAKINVKYYIDGVLDIDNVDNPSALKLHDKTFSIAKVTGLGSLDAGTKYALNLEFKDKTINLRLDPLHWKMVYEDLDYSTSTILPNSNKDNEGVLWLYYREDNVWKAGSRDRIITMMDGDIQGRFYILAPTSGQWQITTYPAEAAQYFTVEPSSGAIEDLVDSEGNFQGNVEFLIKPKGVVPATQTVHFNVDIMLNGQWRNANTEFNRKDWRLTREP